MATILFAMESYQNQSLPVSAQRCVNMYLERERGDAKSQIPLYGVHGMEQFADCGVGRIRGMWVMDDLLYAVSGQSLYYVSSGGTATEVGTGIGGNGRVSMADNGTQLVIVNGQGGYLYTIAAGLNPITDPAFYPSDRVTFFDNYFVFNRSGTNQYFLSMINDGGTYDALDFASAEASPNDLISLEQNLQLLFLFSADHIEVWYDAGSPDFPFQRYSGGVIWRGCIASHSVVRYDNAIFFLGDDLSFYRLQGNQPFRVSTHAIENIIKEDPNPSSAHCFTHTFKGHKMVYLTLPTSKRTLGFDISSNTWHERESWDEDSLPLGRWRANCSTEAYGKQLVGDFYDGVISELKEDVFTELGNTIQVKLNSAPIHFDKKRVFMSRLELDMETGVGLANGQGSNPQVMMKYSKDGGRTWATLEPWRSLGPIGDYQTRQRWLRVGQAYQWVFELTLSDPVKRTFIAAHADITVGM